MGTRDLGGAWRGVDPVGMVGATIIISCVEKMIMKPLVRVAGVGWGWGGCELVCRQAISQRRDTMQEGELV